MSKHKHTSYSNVAVYTRVDSFYFGLIYVWKNGWFTIRFLEPQ
ncbi:hypothetical protein [Neobacillus vireti]